ncbi:MAG: TrkH family potassium uptake protein [Hyphomicrobiales bacterium]
MNNTLLLLIGWALAVVAAFLGVMVFAALAFGEIDASKAFLYDALVTLFFAAGLIFGYRGQQDRMDRAHISILMLAIWLGLPVFAALPFVTLQVVPDFANAYFEAVSGLTTTGASVIEKLDEVPRSIILWRALLHGIGGGLTLLTVVLVLAPFDAALSPVKSSVPGYEEGDLPKSVIATSRDILPFYLSLILFTFAGLWLVNLPALDALVFAISAVSTGGFMPSDGRISDYNAPFAELIICLAMLAGATSFIAHRADLIRQRSGGHRDVPESHMMLTIVPFAALLLAAITIAESWDSIDEPANPVAAARYGAFRAISLITTTGLDNAPLGTVPAPYVLVLGLIMIGGAAFSTAGGLKLFRISMLLAQSHRELKRLIHPRAVTRAFAAGKHFTIQTLKPVWALLFVFLFSAGVIALIISLEGESFETALVAAVAALSNAGPAMGIALGEGGSVHSYATMSTASKLTLALGMVLGRLEFLAVFGLLSWWWQSRTV